LALDITRFFQALPERGLGRCRLARRPAVEETDHWQCCLLRPRRERPRDDRAANKRDEFASFHQITSRQARSPESRWARSAPPTDRIAHLSDGRRLLRCGISIWLMSARGHSRPRLARPKAEARPLRPKADKQADVSLSPLSANSGCEQSQQTHWLFDHLV